VIVTLTKIYNISPVLLNEQLALPTSCQSGTKLRVEISSLPAQLQID